MWPRLTLEDLKVSGHYLGYLIVVTGAVMAIPFIIALANSHYDIAVNYLIGIGVCLVSGFLLCMLKINPTTLKRKQAVVITALAWLMCSLVAAIPLAMSGHYLSYFDSLFEAMSGFTTSGFSLCIDIDHMSVADNVWRFIMHFIGGQGLIVVVLTIGTFARSGSRASLYDAEGRHDHVLPEVRQTTLFIAKFSVSVIVVSAAIMTAILMIKGFDVQNAVLHGTCVTIAAYDTAGFSLMSTGLSYYHSWPLEIVCIVGMIMGAINFTLYNRLLKGGIKDFFRNFELQTFALLIGGVTVIVMVMMGMNGWLGNLDTMLRKGIFTVISATTSTGSQVISGAQMTSLIGTGTIFVLAVAMSIGGMSESMAGGLKAFRLGVMTKEIIIRIKRVLSPDSARMVSTYEHVGKKTITQAAVGTTLVVTALFVGSFLIGAIMAMAYGYDATTALFDSVSATSNNGLTTGIISPGMPLPMEIVYFIQMWLGRLEFLTVIAFLVALFTSIKPDRRRKLR